VILQIGTLQWCCLNTIHHHKNIPTIRKTLVKPVPKSLQYAWGNLSRIIMHLGWISDLQKLGWVANFSDWDKPHLFCNSNHKEVKDQMYDSTFMRGSSSCVLNWSRGDGTLNRWQLLLEHRNRHSWNLWLLWITKIANAEQKFSKVREGHWVWTRVRIL
jgi:hypothetical protein